MTIFVAVIPFGFRHVPVVRNNWKPSITLEPGDLGALIDAMTTALVELFHAGEREEAALRRYAVSRALAVDRYAAAPGIYAGSWC